MRPRFRIRVRRQLEDTLLRVTSLVTKVINVQYGERYQHWGLDITSANVYTKLVKDHYCKR